MRRPEAAAAAPVFDRQAADARPDAFLSYSRRDSAVVDELAAALEERGKEIWVDRDDLPPAERWRDELTTAIEAADNFLFVISPDSVASPHCLQELEHAESLGKRIVPVLLALPPELPRPLDERQYIDSRAVGDRLADIVLAALVTDEWVRAHASWLSRARAWETAGRDPSLLLRGRELEAAEAWLAAHARRKNAEPRPAGLHTDFVLAGRRSATSRLRRTIIAVGVALAVSIGLAIFAIIQREASIRQAEIATSRELAATALGEVKGDPELGVLLARQALERAQTDAAEHALRQSVAAATVRVVARHRGSVEAAAFDATGRRLVSGSRDGTARVSDAATGRALATLSHGGIVYDAAFSSDGELVVTTGSDGAARVWQPDRAKPLAVLRHPDLVWSGELSGDGRRLLTAGEDGVARVWDWSGGRRLARLRHPESVAEAHFDATGARVVTASWDGRARVWDWQREVVLAELAHPALAPVTSAAFSADGKLVATGTGSSGVTTVIQVWHWAQARLLSTLVGHEDLVTSVAFSPDSERLVTASWDETVRVWDWRAGTAVAELRAHASEVHDAGFGPDGGSVATAGADGTVRIWRLNLQLPIAELEAHEGFAWDGSFDSEGQLVLTAGEDGSARVWAWREGRQVAELRSNGGDVFAAAFSRDGRWAATGAEDGTTRVWDVQTETARTTLSDDAQLSAVAFSPDAKLVATASWASLWKGTAVVWDWRAGRRLRDRAVPSGLSAAAFHPGGSLLAVAGNDAAIRVWDWSHDRVVVTLRGHTSRVATLAFSRDGRYLLSASEDATARVWDLEANRQVAELHAGGEVEAAAFDGNASLVATAEEGGRVRVWNWRRGTSFLEFYGGEVILTAVDFSADGRLLLTTGSDGRARVYGCDVCGPLEDVEELAARRVRRALTPAERARFLHE